MADDKAANAAQMTTKAAASVAETLMLYRAWMKLSKHQKSLVMKHVESLTEGKRSAGD
jgi:hypothetical protein